MHHTCSICLVLTCIFYLLIGLHRNSIHLCTGHCIHSHTVLLVQPVHYHRWADQTLKNASIFMYKEYQNRLINVNIDLQQHPANRDWKWLVKMDFRLGLKSTCIICLPSSLVIPTIQTFKPPSKRLLLIRAGFSCVGRKSTVIRGSFLLSLHQSSILSCTPRLRVWGP